MTKYEFLMSNTLFDNIANEESGSLKDISFSILDKLYSLTEGENLQKTLKRLRPELSEKEFYEYFNLVSDAISL